MARFFEQVEPFVETDGALTLRGYAYDEYHLELPLYDGLAEDILAGYDGYLAQAKLEEAERETIPNLKAQLATLGAKKAALAETVCTLEAQLTDTQLALCDVYEQAVTASGGEV